MNSTSEQSAILALSEVYKDPEGGDVATLVESFRRIIGDDNVIDPESDPSALEDARRRYRGRALAILRPGSTEELALLVRACCDTRTPIVVQGGNTGLMGGGTPDPSGRSVLIQLSRLRRIRDMDTDNDTVTVEAGCVLQDVQSATRAVGRLFPLSLGAEGSCTIGGNLGTNAGGTQVLRYGNARELTLGLEVVTAEGEIWNGLRGLRKDNTGYDLRDLYIGSEGTLGIITAATLRLYPLPQASYAGLLAFAGLAEAVAFLSVARQRFSATLTAFEIISAEVLRLIGQNRPQFSLPVNPGEAGVAWYALLEISDTHSHQNVRNVFTDVVAQGVEDGLVIDAIVAESEAQRQHLWLLREHEISAAQNVEGPNVKHDVSVRISQIPSFVDEVVERLRERFPGCRPVIFGHLGDGNLHFNVSAPEGQDAHDFMQWEQEIHDIVHEAVRVFSGSISAEHGIGQAKVSLLRNHKSAVELDLMLRIKQALDPHNLFNPGKVLQPVLDKSQMIVSTR